MLVSATEMLQKAKEDVDDFIDILFTSNENDQYSSIMNELRKIENLD